MSTTRRRHEREEGPPSILYWLANGTNKINVRQPRTAEKEDLQSVGDGCGADGPRRCSPPV